MQHDGSLTQLASKYQNGSVITRNWVHDTPKNGLRFDAPEPELKTLGGNGTMSFNVIWNSGGLVVKNDYQTIINNIVFNSTSMWPTGPCDITINAQYPTENVHSIFKNNGASCMEDKNNKKKVGIRHNNIVGPVETQLRDPRNLDFRPKPDSKYEGQFIGPYRVNDTSYWIPGRQSHIASHPIPPHDAWNVPIDTDLIWMEGFHSISHRIFHGKEAHVVNNACNGNNDQCFRASFSLGNNILFSNHHFIRQPNTTYFWRVDTVYSDHIMHGPLWNFTTQILI